jgi:hypothetical protein
MGDTTKAGSFVCVGDNYPIVPIDDSDHGHGDDH